MIESTRSEHDGDTIDRLEITETQEKMAKDCCANKGASMILACSGGSNVWWI